MVHRQVHRLGGLWSEELHVQRCGLGQAQRDGVAPEVRCRDRSQIVVGQRRVDVEELEVEPVDAVVVAFANAVRAVVGVVRQVESAKLHVRAVGRVGVGRFAVSACHARVGSAAPVGSTHVTVCPVHVEVADLGVVAVRKNAALWRGDDDLEAVGEVGLVVVVPHLDEVHVHRILRLLPFDFTHSSDVRVLPVSCDLVVFRSRKARGGPVNHVATERDLSFGVDVKELVFLAVQLKHPRVGLVADGNGLG